MAALLALVTVAIYWPVMRHAFVNYDDPAYVTDNPHVQAGLTWEGLAWSFGRVHGSQTYWHPLTWVSHMVDCQLYGLKSGGHHLTSMLLHAANAVLVFLVFSRMTGAFWRCVVLSALFALHPLQVDSVAWVAERKTLLSAFFWLLSLWAYVRYAELQSPKSKVQSPAARVTGHGTRIAQFPSLFYFLSLFFMACGLMSKPVLVTIPFVLLLLDYWPLRRFQHSTLNAPRSTSSPIHGLELKTQDSGLKVLVPLLWEKLPFFALAVAASVITVLAHQALGMLNSVSTPPWDARLENALVSYVRYLGKTFWPSRLAVFYPYPTAWPMWPVVACALLLLAISGLVLGAARSRPWLFVGWFWFLGVLVPFIGLIQAGAQAMADRFMYLPALGIFVALIWGLHGLAKRWRYQPNGLSVAGAAAILLCLVLTRRQLGYWKNSETLFQHALGVTENNYLAHNSLGTVLGEKGQIDEAMREFRKAIRLKPDYALAHNNLGSALNRKGQIDEAIGEFQEVIRLKPNYAEAHKNLGMALFRQGQTDEAIRELQAATRLKPDDAEAHHNLGMTLFRQGQIDEAIGEFRQAIRLQPDFPEAHNNLGNALVRQGQIDEGISQYQEAIRLKPDYALAHSNLGIALVRKGQIDDGISEFQEAIRLKPDFTEARHNLALALAMKNTPAGK
jgi:tetratricopeptide (TPR) repeat protein